jgi:regulator of protease activity HflC (stomatin/prohibitin superfamily)
MFVRRVSGDYLHDMSSYHTFVMTGQMMVIERLGKFRGVAEGGFFLSIPFVDEIRFVIDMREKAMAIAPQAAITKDNVHVSVSGNLFCQFVDATKAAYGSKSPMYSVRQHAQSAMRAAIGEMELDEILHARVKLNENIKAAVAQAAEQWGLEIKRYEITEISPDKHITEVRR